MKYTPGVRPDISAVKPLAALSSTILTVCPSAFTSASITPLSDVTVNLPLFGFGYTATRATWDNSLMPVHRFAFTTISPVPRHWLRSVPVTVIVCEKAVTPVVKVMDGEVEPPGDQL